MVAFLPKYYPIFTPVYSGVNYASLSPISTKVKALQFINNDVSTTSVDTRDFGLETPSNINEVNVLEHDGILVSQESVLNSVWIKMLDIANDQRGTNVELEASENGISLKTIRPIYPGEPLLMWFGNNLRTILNIPYLNASNIHNMDYKCHICGKLFNWPNPLLMHLTLKCDSIAINDFWRMIAIDWLSFFRSYTDFRIENILSSSNAQLFSKRHLSLKPLHYLDRNKSHALKNMTYDPLAMENEASNSGRTADGYFQCRICLKKYSRKHGLKIHFRIHTGYKPLSCKVCNRAFGDPSNLNKHVRLHATSETSNKYKCDTCNQGVIRRRDLERHIILNHPEMVQHE